MLNREVEKKIKDHDSQLEQKATKDEAQNIQTQVNNLVLGAVGDGNNPEVVQARGSFPLLDTRLTNIDLSRIGKNLFNKITRSINMFLNSDTGIPFSMTGKFTSDYIMVSATTSYYGSNVGRVCAYDNTKKFIGSLTIANGVFTTTDNTVYIRLSGDEANADLIQVEVGTKNTGYEPYKFYLDNTKIKDVIPSNLLGMGYPIELIDGVVVGKNLFNKDTSILDSYLNSDTGQTYVSNGNFSSDFILVGKNTNYAMKNIARVIAYDSNRKYISSLTMINNVITTPNNATFIKICGATANIDTVQSEKGSISTTYEKYSITIKNMLSNSGGVTESKSDKKVIVSRLPNSIYRVSDTNNVIIVGIYDYASNVVFANDLTEGKFKIVTWQTLNGDATYPTNCSFVYKALMFKGKVYAIGKDTSDGLWKVWRGVVSFSSKTIAWETNPVWTARDTIVNVQVTANFNCSSDYIFIGEYGYREDTLNPMLWRSSDGTAWDNIYQLSNARHFHGVNCDPYVQGSVWMCSGEPDGRIYYSADNGTTFTKITTDLGYQSVQISFTETDVYFADDSTRQSVTVVNKKKLKAFNMSNDIHNTYAVHGGDVEDSYYRNAFYGAVTNQGVYYGIINDTSSGGNTAGVFRCLELGGGISVLGKATNLSTPENYSMLAECYITNNLIYFNQNFLNVTKVDSLSNLI